MEPSFMNLNCYLQTLTLARDYAAAVNKPFPEIDEKILEERDWPKDCYVFEGKEKEPTIVYMPLFNRNNCKGLLQPSSQHQACQTCLSNHGFFFLVQMRWRSKQRWRSSPPSSFHLVRRRLSLCWRRRKPT